MTNAQIKLEAKPKPKKGTRENPRKLPNIWTDSMEMEAGTYAVFIIEVKDSASVKWSIEDAFLTKTGAKEALTHYRKAAADNSVEEQEEGWMRANPPTQQQTAVRSEVVIKKKTTDADIARIAEELKQERDRLAEIPKPEKRPKMPKFKPGEFPKYQMRRRLITVEDQEV